jgi:hypothetical protein
MPVSGYTKIRFYSIKEATAHDRQAWTSLFVLLEFIDKRMEFLRYRCLGVREPVLFFFAHVIFS